MGVWGYGSVGVWEYGSMGVWEYTVSVLSPSKDAAARGHPSTGSG